MKKYTIFVVIVVIVLVGFLAINFYKKRSIQPDQLVDVSLRLKWFVNPSYVGEIAAKELGFYKKNGLNVTINPGGPDLNSVRLVASGADLIGSTSFEEVILARAKGIPVVAIGAEFKDNPSCWISLKDSGLDKFEKFSGKTVGVAYGDNTEVLYKAILDKLGMLKANINEEPFRFTFAPLLERKVDVMPAYLNDQVITLENQGNQLNVVCAKDYGFNPYGNVYIVTEQTIKEKPEILVEFLKGSIEGWKYVQKNTEQSIPLLLTAMQNSLESKSALDSVRATLDLMNLDKETIFLMDRQRIEDTQDLLLKFGDLKQKIDIAAAFTNEFLNKSLK